MVLNITTCWEVVTLLTRPSLSRKEDGWSKKKAGLRYKKKNLRVLPVLLKENLKYRKIIEMKVTNIILGEEVDLLQEKTKEMSKVLPRNLCRGMLIN